MEKVSNAAGAKLRDLKRRKDFDEMILPARKVARTGAERQARRRRFFMVFNGSSCFQFGFSWFFSKIYPPKLYPGPMIQSRSAARRAA